MYNWLAMSFFCCYWKFKPPHCLWLRYLWRIYATYIFLIESTGSVRRCFRSEHESDNPIPRVLSRVCVSEGTNQAPFSINELCRFHIRQWVGVGMVEPISVTRKWVSEWVTHLHIETNHKSRLGIYVLKNWFTVKVHYNIYCCCSTFVLS